jgi:hypothetical protein
MAATTHDFVSQRFTRSGRARGPVTAAKLRRTALVYAASCALGIAPTFLGLSPALQAAGLGLWFPGAGFLAAGGWSVLLLPVALALFGLALFAWFGSGMGIAPPLVWLGAAALAGVLGADGVNVYAAYGVPALTLAGGFALRRRNEKARAARRAKRAGRAAALPGELATVGAFPKTAAGERELSGEQLAHARYLLDRALQPIGQLAGFDRVDQFQTAALRYQINHLGYALAELQCSYAPSFHGYLAEAQRNLIHQYLQKPIWSYWIYETAWGHLNWTSFDPAARDNIMLTGWFGAQLGLYTSSTGDRRFAEPGSLPFVLNERTTYAHDIHTIVRSVSDNFARADFYLYPCEPNWIYPICNHSGMLALRLHDRLFGSAHVKTHLDAWLHQLDHEFTDESGSIIGLRSELTGLQFPFPAGESGFAAYMGCWAPERAERMWAIAHHELSRAIVPGADGAPRITMPGRGFDFGNYRRGWASTYAGILLAAREFGDFELADAAERALDQDGGRTRSRGVIHYAGASNLGNIQAAAGKLRGAGDFRRAVTQGPPEATLSGPILADARYPDVLVARAVSDGTKLDLVLHAGGEPGVQTLRIERLAPGRGYQVRGARTERIVADASGAASFELALEGRSTVEIAPL